MKQKTILGLILILNFIVKNITLVITSYGISKYGIGIEVIQQTAEWYMNGTLWINMNLYLIILTILIGVIYKLNRKLSLGTSIFTLIFFTWNLINDAYVLYMLGG